jgi:hypothetical protein
MDLSRSRSIPVPGIDFSLPPPTSAPLSALDSSMPLPFQSSEHLPHPPPPPLPPPLPPVAAARKRARTRDPAQTYRWSRSELSRLVHGLAMAGADLPRVAKVVSTRNVNAVRRQLSAIAARIAPCAGAAVPAHTAARLVLHHHRLAHPPPGQPVPPPTIGTEKFPVQVVAALSAHADALRSDGHNPCVEILLSSHKTVWDIVYHLYGKWGRPLALQDPAAATIPGPYTVDLLRRQQHNGCSPHVHAS